MFLEYFWIDTFKYKKMLRLFDLSHCSQCLNEDKFPLYYCLIVISLYSTKPFSLNYKLLVRKELVSLLTFYSRIDGL